MHGFVKSPKAIAAPVARRKPQKSIHHGIEIVDDYAWLRAENWQDVMRDPQVLDPEIRAYLDAENAYTDAQLSDTRDLQEVLFQEMKGRIKEDDSSVPAPDGRFAYYMSYVTGGQYPRVMRRATNARGTAAPETIIIDGNLEGDGKPYWSLGESSLGLVQAAGFAYDSSLMADDYRLYRVRHRDRHSVFEGSRFGPEGTLVEVPVSWVLDDWPHFEPSSGGDRDGLSAPSKVLEIWTEELRYAWAHAPGGLLTITMHPECIGRGHRMAMLERFIDAATALEGVVFDRLDRSVDRWLHAQRAVTG